MGTQTNPKAFPVAFKQTYSRLFNLRSYYIFPKSKICGFNVVDSFPNSDSDPEFVIKISESGILEIRIRVDRFFKSSHEPPCISAGAFFSKKMRSFLKNCTSRRTFPQGLFFPAKNGIFSLREGLHEIDLEKLCRLMVFLCHFEPWGTISCQFLIFWGRGIREDLMKLDQAKLQKSCRVSETWPLIKSDPAKAFGSSARRSLIKSDPAKGFLWRGYLRA